MKNERFLNGLGALVIAYGVSPIKPHEEFPQEPIMCTSGQNGDETTYGVMLPESGIYPLSIYDLGDGTHVAKTVNGPISFELDGPSVIFVEVNNTTYKVNCGGTETFVSFVGKNK